MLLIWHRRLLIGLLLLLSFQTQAASRTVFVQMFEWTWKDIASECETYLGPNGFSAVQTSPPHEHLFWRTTPWWDRYQVVSYNLNSRSGTEAEYRDMIERCQKWAWIFIADAVINHMTGMIDGEGFAGSKFSHYNHPGLYSETDFHHCGRNGNNNIKDYKDRFEVQNCELVDLADLNTESEHVRNQIAKYLNSLLDMGVKGLRIDAAKHIPAEDLAAIYRKLNHSPYIYQEIIYDPTGPIQYGEYTPYGDVYAYDYTQIISKGFRGKNPEALKNIASHFPASHLVISSITNHDLERHGNSDILSYNSSERGLYLLGQTFMLAWPFGYPQLYSGFTPKNFDQGPPVDEKYRTKPILDANNNCIAPWTCEHRLPEVAAMVDFRNQTSRSFYANHWWSNGYDQLAFGRGTVGFIAINYSSFVMTRDFATSLPEGSYCNILADDYDLKNKTCTKYILVDNRGHLQAVVAPMKALALLKTSPYKAK